MNDGFKYVSSGSSLIYPVVFPGMLGHQVTPYRYSVQYGTVVSFVWRSYVKVTLLVLGGVGFARLAIVGANMYIPVPASAAFGVCSTQVLQSNYTSVTRI